MHPCSNDKTIGGCQQHKSFPEIQRNIINVGPYTAGSNLGLELITSLLVSGNDEPKSSALALPIL